MNCWLFNGNVPETAPLSVLVTYINVNVWVIAENPLNWTDCNVEKWTYCELTGHFFTINLTQDFWHNWALKGPDHVLEITNWNHFLVFICCLLFLTTHLIKYWIKPEFWWNRLGPRVKINFFDLNLPNPDPVFKSLIVNWVILYILHW